MRSRSAFDFTDSGIPVVDLFAGPGGLGEGFSSVHREGLRGFRVALSVEREAQAHETLLLRSFLRQFPDNQAPDDYYELAHAGQDARQELYSRHQVEAETARTEARQAELGVIDPATVDGWIERALRGRKAWVLVGGPPCQAYSLVGRARNRGKQGYCPEDDARHFLYREYLRIIERHWPPVFVFENVKGLLSARIDGNLIFGQILDDLSQPSVGAGSGKRYRYKIHSLIVPTTYDDVGCDRSHFVVKAEDYGIPQARHRILLLGVREDVGARAKPGVLERSSDIVSVASALRGLPPLRSRLSRQVDGSDEWLAALQENRSLRWMHEPGDVAEMGLSVLEHAQSPSAEAGADAISWDSTEDAPCLADWFIDGRAHAVYNHSARGHRRDDLQRYFFAACYAATHRVSPVLSKFPSELLPAHANVQQAVTHGHFSDRFRVQVSGRPATTITSHIAKDGHYFIHPDPAQCRSLTVREAARIQTFPDNYIFCGGRTAQYIQVGNAVPPLLARQIAEVVLQLLERAKLAGQ